MKHLTKMLWACLAATVACEDPPVDSTSSLDRQVVALSAPGSDELVDDPSVVVLKADPAAPQPEPDPIPTAEPARPITRDFDDLVDELMRDSERFAEAIDAMGRARDLAEVDVSERVWIESSPRIPQGLQCGNGSTFELPPSVVPSRPDSATSVPRSISDVPLLERLRALRPGDLEETEAGLLHKAAMRSATPGSNALDP